MFKLRITISSRSIGAAIAKQLASDGASVVVNYVSDADSAEKVIAEIRANRCGAAVAVKADVSSVQGATSLLDETLRAFGKVNILFIMTLTVTDSAISSTFLFSTRPSWAPVLLPTWTSSSMISI